MAPAARLDATIVGANGKPVAGSHLHLSQGGPEPFDLHLLEHRSSGFDGRLTLEPVPPGDSSVTAGGDGPERSPPQAITLAAGKNAELLFVVTPKP